MAQIFYNRLPRGLHLVQNEDGTASILGVPDDLPGYYRFSIRCEDSNKNIAIRDYEIEVVWTDDFNSNTIQRYTLNTSGTASPTISDSELDFTVSNDSHSSLTYKDRQDLKNGEIGIELSEADDTGIVIAFLNDSDYYAIVVYDASSAIIAKRNTIELIKKTGSTYSSPLATSSISFTRGNNHTIHSTIDNGIITAFFDNTEVWSYDTGNINLEGAMGPRSNRSPSIFDKFWYRTQDMVSFVDGDYPQPPLDLAINGYVPSSWAYNDYESSTVELIGTPPFILETDNLPPTYSAVVNGNYVELSGPPLPKGDYTFKLIAKDSSNNTAILPVTMQMLAMEWTMEEIVDDSVEIIGGNGIFVGVFLYGGSLPNGVTYSLDGTNIKLSGKPSGLVDKDRGSAVFKVIDSDNEETLVKIGWELNYDVEWKPIHMDNAPKIWVGHESDIVDDFGVCSEIENKGTLGGIFSQTTNANRPAILYESDIGIRALRFDGSNDYIQGESGFNWISLLSGVENAWSFTTYKSDTVTATDRYPFRINHSSNTNIRYSSIASDTSYANRPGIGGRSQVSPMDNYSSIYAGITVGNDWTTSFQRIDYLNKTGYVRVNGGNEASNILSNMTADVSQNVTSSVPYIGSFNAGYFSGDISQVIFGVGDIKQYDIDRAEGYSMHVSGLNDGLPSNHPFRHVPPYTGTPKLNFDNNDGNLVYGFITTSDNGNVGVSKGDDNFGTFFNDGPILGVGENFSLIYTDSTLLIFESSDIDSTVNEAVLYDYKGLKLATIPLSYSGGTVYGSSGYELKEDEIYYVIFNSVEYDLEDHYVNENDDSYVNENEDFYSREGVGSSGTLTISGQLQEWIVGLPVLDTLTVSGGSGQYTSVTVLSGSMPNGVSLQLELDQIKFVGIPLEPSSGSLTVSVLDDIGNYGETLLEISVVPMGNIFVGGTFWQVDGQPSPQNLILNSDGSINSNVSIQTSGGSYGVMNYIQQADLKILVVGDFTSVNGSPRNSMARFNADLTLDTSFVSVPMDNAIRDAVIQDDGKIIVVGQFTTIHGQSRQRIARLNQDGTLDNSYTPPNVQSTIWASLILDDGSILIGGQFSTVNSIPIVGLAKIFPDGTLDETFNLSFPANSYIYSICLQMNGQILIGGYLGTNSGTLFRINSSGDVDATFNVFANGAIRSVAVTEANKIVIGGDFTTVNSSNVRNRIAWLNMDGTLDPMTVSPTINYNVNRIVAQPDGKILAIGDFFQPHTKLLRINSDGTVDDSISYTFNHGVTSLAMY